MSTTRKYDMAELNRATSMTPSQLLASAKKRDAEDSKTVLKETDPEKILKIAGEKPLEYEGALEHVTHTVGYAPKIAASQNPRAPTLFLLYLYYYPQPTEQHAIGSLTFIGHRNRLSSPYSTDLVADSAFDALVKRKWELTQFEKQKLSVEDRVALGQMRHKDGRKDVKADVDFLAHALVRLSPDLRDKIF